MTRFDQFGSARLKLFNLYTENNYKQYQSSIYPNTSNSENIGKIAKYTKLATFERFGVLSGSPLNQK